jgi:hypothetical protein
MAKRICGSERIFTNYGVFLSRGCYACDRPEIIALGALAGLEGLIMDDIRIGS